MDAASRYAPTATTIDPPLSVGILGVTGVVGQRFVQLLQKHRWFKPTVLGASDRSAGKLLSEATAWRLPGEIPAYCSRLRIVDCDPNNFASCDLVFSALDSAVAGSIEMEFSRRGIPVFSNASSHRMRSDVPILLPLVNPEQIVLAEMQQQRNNAEQSSSKNSTKGGFIITNGNCASTILCIVLAPILNIFPAGRVRKVVVSTLQAISGAGYPGIPSSDIMDNVVPFIAGEEEKIEAEPRKVLGKVNRDGIQELPLPISAMIHRVPVLDGHLISVSLEIAPEDTAAPENTDTCFKKSCAKLIYERLEQFEASPEVQNLPSCPKKPIIVRRENDRPQPRLDRLQGDGMSVAVGNIRPCSVNTVKFTAVGHNAIIGAAGCSILNAELAVKGGLILSAPTGRLS